MDTYVATVFDDAQTEFANIQSGIPSIDFTDISLTPSLVPTFTASSAFQITSPSSGGFGEIEFLLGNSFWGVGMNFGNDPNGIQIRQGIWHMIDTANFAANEPTIAGQASATDTPEPPSGGLLSANPCAWDSMFPETGPQCTVGAAGGTAYHLQAATGANGNSWLQAPGSADLNAAAAHFVAAGIATGCDGGSGVASCNSSHDSILSGISSAAKAHPVSFFIRNDNPALLDLGNSLSEQICYLFTGSYNVPCNELTVTKGPIDAFTGLTTSSTSVNLSWGMFTSGISASGAIGDGSTAGGDLEPHRGGGGGPFDSTLYFEFNSNFVDGNPSIVSSPPNFPGPCSPTSLTGGSAASNYMYLCNQPYDSISNQMEFAPCLTTTGDPSSGSTINNSTGTCPNTTSLSAVGAGIETEDAFGKKAYTIPIYGKSNQFGLLNDGFRRVVNSPTGGMTNFFTYLDAYNPTPPVSGTIRQGFSQSTKTLDPYEASTVWDGLILGNIYSSLMLVTPLTIDNLMNWMVLSVQQLPNSAVTYALPPGTTQTFRFTLRSDMFFADGERVNSFDVAFSYLSMLATGAFQAGGLEPMLGVTILGPFQIDFNVKAVGPFTLQSLFGVTVLPGRYWTVVPRDTWTGHESNCLSGSVGCFTSQYTLNAASGPGVIPPVSCSLTCGFPASDMNVNPNNVGAAFDPVANNILIGSGPWFCGSTSSNTNCSSSGSQNPPVAGSYVLSRFGKGLSPGSSIQNIYFRSSGNLALYLWSLNTGDITADFLNFSVVASCFGKPVTSTGPCAHFQQGIGAPSGGGPVGLSQVAIVNRFVGVNWIAPFSWANAPPAGIVPLNPVLYENTITMNPASVAPCSTPYPMGGYDC